MNFEKISKRKLFKNWQRERERVRRLLITVEQQAQKLKEFSPGDEIKEHLLNIESIKAQYEV